MNDAEEMKKSLPDGTSKAEHAYIVENFVLSQFTMVEKEERAIRTDVEKRVTDLLKKVFAKQD